MQWWRSSLLSARRFASSATTTRQRGRKRLRQPVAATVNVQASDLALRLASTKELIALVETHTPLILRFLKLQTWLEVFLLFTCSSRQQSWSDEGWD